MAARSEVDRGQSVYTPLFLRVYDTMILGVSCRWIWRCPAPRMLRHYDENVGARHCDVGVGSGYFLDKAEWPAEPSITLVDLNPNSLAAASRRIARYEPVTVKADVLEPLPPLERGPFDSVGVNLLLHCLPGTFPGKATTVLSHITPHVAPGGVVFGATILAEGVPRSAPARALAAMYNRKGIFHNDSDSLDGLATALEGAFATHSLEVVGCVALFAGRVAAG